MTRHSVPRDGDATTLREKVGERIRDARMRAGLSQRALAARVGASSPGAVAQWEAGANTPTVARLIAVADALSESVDGLPGRRPAAVPADPATEADLVLVREARQPGLDLRAVLADARQRRWLAENRDALSDANEFLDRHGLWSDGRRLF